METISTLRNGKPITKRSICWNWALPVTLESQRVRLIPLAWDNFPRLAEIGVDLELWRFTAKRLTSPEDVRANVTAALAAQNAGTGLPWPIYDRQQQQVVGSTRYADIDEANFRLEIGWTWIEPRFHCSRINLESKWLQLRYAFESLSYRRVSFKVVSTNLRSQESLLKLGAKLAGTMRNYASAADGSAPDVCIFSIIASEWAVVELRLRTRLLKS